jgi:ElaB/YqjD/DUF883 family membrane-anchored ribosome-binding protein
MTPNFPSDAERSNGTRVAAGDDAFARLEKEMAAMKDAIGDLSNQIADAASDLGAAAQEQAKRGLQYAGASADSIAVGASSRVGAAASAAQTQASSLADTLEDTVREHPLAAVAFALGLGFLIGAIRRR